MIEKDFVSELLWAQVMGEPTDGLSSRWPKTNIAKEEAEEFCRRRTQQEIDSLAFQVEDLLLSGDEGASRLLSRQAEDLRRRPYRLPTQTEWLEDFEKDPFPHIIYGLTTDVEGERGIALGGSLVGGPALARASHRLRGVPGFRNDLVGFRCAR